LNNSKHAVGANAPTALLRHCHFFGAVSAMSSVVVLDRLTKRFGRRTAVQNVSFEVHAGEVFGLLGPNGSGKTTILRILTCYLQPTSGRASVAGFDVGTDSLSARRKLGYVPEDVPLYPNMRVGEFLRFMASLRGLTGKVAGTAVDRSVDQLSLASVRNVAIAKLSRGFRQRTMIAQALLDAPEFLILDEPTNGLDPRQIIELRELIRALSERHTILITSHILSEIERVATRVAILLNGQLLTVKSLKQTGTTRLLVRTSPGSGDTVRLLLADLSGVKTVARSASADDGADAHLAEVDNPAVAAHIATALSGAGVGLLELRAKSTDLEDLFLEVTQGEPV
jgi:gliding motility-associated transport system ATP-binding protein